MLSFENEKSLDDGYEVIQGIYDKFFKVCYLEIYKKYGVRPTRLEVVDFILYSVNDILQDEFRKTLSDEGVNILNPFAGSGTFINRLLQSEFDLIKPENLQYKYKNEIYANEIFLFGYYLAVMSIEDVYYKRVKDGNIEPFNGICLMDSFNYKENKRESRHVATQQENDISITNNAGFKQPQKQSRITVIIGDLPFSESRQPDYPLDYPDINDKIQETYGIGITKYKLWLYQIYLKAFRYFSDLLSEEEGIIAFETPNSWISKQYTSTFRKCLVKEFTKIYIFDFKGYTYKHDPKQGQSVNDNRDDSNHSYGKSLTFLVKKKNHKGFAEIKYYDIGDYLLKDEKRCELTKHKSIKDWKHDKLINPVNDGEWVIHSDKDQNESDGHCD